MKVFRQEKPYSCGAAVLRSLLFHFKNVDIPEESIRRLLGTSRRGTSTSRIVDVMEELGLKTEMLEDSSIGDLEVIVENGFPVVINYYKGGGHFGIVVGDNGSCFEIADPERGRIYSLSKKILRRNWHNHKSTEWNWGVIIKGLKNEKD
jgi:ABC-type bacteriocin/lantibiotic exporter with double-glycine peptidase domain